MMQVRSASLWRRLKIPLIALLLGAAVIAAYHPGLRGPFVFDDSIHVVNNPSIRISTLNLTSLLNAGFFDGPEVLKRPLANMSFALNYYISDGELNAYGFKLTNLAIHLLNTGLVYWLTVLLMAQLRRTHEYVAQDTVHWVPALTAALWALHPIQLTSILYVVQRMNSLSALFVLAGLIAFMYGRQHLSTNATRGFSMMSAGLLAGLVLGVASKENAALLPLFVALIEISFFRHDDIGKGVRRRLWLFYAMSAAICLFALVWSIASGIVEKSYLGREYTLVERLLTESRILWHYIGLVLLPDLRKFSLFHDDIPLSSGLLVPWTTLPALTSILLGALAAVLLIKRQPIFGFSVLWFLIGHSMESGLIGLEIAHEHRNYLPSMGLTMGIAYGLCSGFGSFRARFAPAILGVALVSALGAVTYLRAQTWSTEEGIITRMVHHHPLSARSQHMMGEFTEKQLRDPVNAILHHQKAAELAPHETGYYIKMAMTAATARMQATPGDRIPGVGVSSSTPRRIPLSSLASLVRSQNEIRLELNNTITSRIANSLKQDPPSALTVNTLQALARCVDQATDDCERLRPEMIGWYRSLLENPHLHERVRNDFTTYLFNLGMNLGNYDLALWSAKTSQRHDPGNHIYSLMESNVYISLNQLDKAEEILASISHSSRPLDIETMSSRNQLLSIIRTRREARDSRMNP